MNEQLPPMAPDAGQDPAAQQGGDDMAVIQIPHALLEILAQVFTQAAQKSATDIAAQKGSAPGTMAPDQQSGDGSLDNFGSEIDKKMGR